MAELLGKFSQYAESLRVTGVAVWQDGRVAARLNVDEEHRRNLYSASKSFTSAAVGIAVREGLLSLEERVADCFAGEVPEAPCRQLMELRVKHLLSMCLGQRDAFLMGEQRLYMREHNWVRACLAQPFDCAPGERFLYTNAGPYLAGKLVERRAGCSLASYLQPRLFDKLDIWRPTWETDPEGGTMGAGGLMLAVSELLKFGVLYLERGRYAGARILDEEWVAQTQIDRRPGGPVDGRGYGYLFWTEPQDHAYMADGKYGQYAIILEDKRAVVAVSAESREPDRIRQCLRETVYPLL